MSDTEDEYTPTTEEVRDAYAQAKWETFGSDTTTVVSDTTEARLAFYRWLAAHDAEVWRIVPLPVDADRLRAARTDLEDVIRDYAEDYDLREYSRRTKWADIEKAIADYDAEVRVKFDMTRGGVPA